MSSGEYAEGYAIPEHRQRPTMDALFEVVEKRLGEATDFRQHNKHVGFFVIEEVDNQSFYVLTLAKSYERFLSTPADADLMELLIPAMGIDTSSPVVEQLVGNDDALMLVRKYLPDGQQAFLIIRPEKIDRYLPPGFNADYDPFFEGVEIAERPADLAFRLGRHVLIPSSVRNRSLEPEQFLVPPN